MKFLFIRLAIIVVAILIFSCQQQEDYKRIRTQVIILHDKVMKEADLAHGLYTVLDSVYRDVHGQDSRDVRIKLAKIEKANREMEEWMEKFEPDVSGKRPSESIDYFKSELQKIRKLDQAYKIAMVDADHYLDSIRHGR